MRNFTLVLSTLILTFIATQAHAGSEEGREPARSSFTCKIATGYGTAIGRGSSALAAKEAARESCGSHLIDQYYAQRGSIPNDAVEDLALACVNLECQ